MTDHEDYRFVANALMMDIHNLLTNGIPETGFNGVPLMFQSLVPAALVPAAAGQFAKTAVDALDKHRAATPPAKSAII